MREVTASKEAYINLCHDNPIVRGGYGGCISLLDSLLSILGSTRRRFGRERAGRHIWELPDNYPVFTVVMIIYCYVKRIRRILVTPNFFV